MNDFQLLKAEYHYLKKITRAVIIQMMRVKI